MRNTNSKKSNGNTDVKLLDRIFGNLVRNTLLTISEEHEERWETYDLILNELKEESNYTLYNEIKYRLTDGENPNHVFRSVVVRGDYLSTLIPLLKSRIDDYIEEDSYDRFYK